jgi:signal transduction histidine kinase
MDKYFDRFINIATTDPDDSRRRSILNILLAGVGVISIAAVIIAVIVNPRVNFTIIVISLISIGGVAIIYFINLRWSGRTASIIFLGLLTVICAFSDTPLEVAAGRALFVFTIPIIMASILLTPWSSFVFGVISSIIISVFANSVGRIPNSPAILGYMLVALVSWLSSRSLEQALKELRVINANLDQIVVERTQALAESLERERLEAGRNKAILNSIGDGVIVFDKKWNATMVNPAVKSMLDIPLDLILNKNFHEFIEHPRLAAQGRNLLSAMIEHDTQPMGFRIEWGEKTLSVGAAQVYDSRGENLGTVTVFRDFTREAEVERLKSTFVAIVSHELRTPLNAILGYAEMFKESVYGPMTDKQIKMAAGIMKNTDQLLGLISDLLDEAQMEAGQLTITNAPLKPAELLETLHSLLDRTASDKRLRLTSEIDDDLPETLSGDADRLQQILTNLVNNSIKFTEHGEICVRLRRTDDAKWGFEVEDTGRGIPEADIPYIFETFRQVEGSTTRVHGGVGLGLAIVKQLVNLMNGEVKVESKVDVGTKFTVILPLAVP